MKKTFAYIILSAQLNNKLFFELETFYWGGIIEAFMTCEEQWVDPDDIWPFEWGMNMDRLSVVQIVENENPCEWITNILQINKIEPIFKKKCGDSLIVFINDSLADMSPFEEVESKFKRRFFDIYKATSEVSKMKDFGLLFIGGKGFSVKEELQIDDQEMLTDIGIKYPSRIPN